MRPLSGWPRWLFVAAALWNFQGLACVLAPGLTQELLLGGPMAGPGAFLWTDLWAFVVIMGLGSALVAWDPERNRGIAVVAAMGKTMAAMHWLLLVGTGVGGAMLAFGALVDLALGVGMIAWLRSTAALSRGDRVKS